MLLQPRHLYVGLENLFLGTVMPEGKNYQNIWKFSNIWEFWIFEGTLS